MNPTYRILLTGFEAFNGEDLNPSALLVENLAKSFQHISAPALQFEKIILPVTYEKSFTQLKNLLNKKKIDFILMLGQAAGREKICLERVALNWADSSLSDAENIKITEKKICSTAPEAYFNPLPLSHWANELSKQELPVTVSTSAGSYVCNDLYFRFFQEFQKKYSFLFVHVPYCQEQVVNRPNIAHLSLDLMTKSLVQLVYLICKDSSTVN